MAKKMSKQMKDEKRATGDDIAKNLKAKWCWKIGSPVSWWTPPSTVADEAKTTVDIRAARKEREMHVLLSHSLLLSRSCPFVSIKICSALFP